MVAVSGERTSVQQVDSMQDGAEASQWSRKAVVLRMRFPNRMLELRLSTCERL